MLKEIRQQVVRTLWEHYRHDTPQMQQVEYSLHQKGVAPLVLDHFAIIDLPGPNTGISYLREIFHTIGYLEQGKDYLADKQNDFLWMTEVDSFTSEASTVLPQVVVADFRLAEMPDEIRNIIEKYSTQSAPSPIEKILALKQESQMVNAAEDPSCRALHQVRGIAASSKIIQTIVAYFKGRDWPLPTLAEYRAVRAFNELLAWVLIFGRRPNHFTLSVHHFPQFDSLKDFHDFVETELTLELNYDGGVIKGGESTGIAQGSTTGIKQKVKLQDGEVEVPTGFVEFVWRYPCAKSSGKRLWSDYFTGFLAKHADRVIESLYVKK